MVEQSPPGFSVIDVDPHTARHGEIETQPYALEEMADDGSRHLYLSETADVVEHLARTSAVPVFGEAARPTPALIAKLGAKTRQYSLGPGLWVHRTEPASAWEIYRETQSIARAWASPHGAPTTAGNFEVLAMNVIHFQKGFSRVMDSRGLSEEEWDTISDQMSPEFWRVSSTVEAFWSVYGVDAEKEPMGFEAFLPLWHGAGFPRLEVGHKLAAALCCTDVPAEIEVRAPWPAWSLVLPDGLFSEWNLGRLWCTGAEWTAAVGKEGVAIGAPPASPGEMSVSCDHGTHAAVSPVAVMIRNLIRGVCLSISEPGEHRKKGAHGGGQKSKGHGPPDLQQSRFILSAPVVIDLREHVAGVSSGRTGTAPKVQFLVRGHWREQAHGADRQLRKRIWIQPFWKGPEGARVLLRSHTVKGEN